MNSKAWGGDKHAHAGDCFMTAQVTPQFWRFVVPHPRAATLAGVDRQAVTV